LFGSEKPRDPTISEKVRNAVSRTKRDLSERLSDLIEGRREIDPELLDDLEAVMIGADIGVKTTTEILDTIRDQVARNILSDPAQLKATIRDELRRILSVDAPSGGKAEDGDPFVILMVGVNGVGKTTTIGKLAHRFAADGKSVLLAAGDTFRAAAIEQLEVWSERTRAPIVKQKPGSDPSAVLFDSLRSARAKKVDVVVVDTAGRLHTKGNLMAELEKMTRVAAREVAGAPHEVLLVIDATTGQNGLIQAREFAKTAALTGIVLTKLDGTARGGVVVAIVRELGIPIRFVGTGEKVDDLVEFSPDEFVDSLFAD
jgi:fused signal recognition particle receptor